MVEGSALLITMIYGMHGLGAWGPRGTNLLDTGAWFYDVYECADGEYISLGSLEPQFFAEMVEKLGIDAQGIDQNDRSTWPEMRVRLTEAVKAKTPGRVVRGPRRLRRLLRTGAQPGRGSGASPQRRPGHLRRCGGEFPSPARHPGSAALRPRLSVLPLILVNTPPRRWPIGVSMPLGWARYKNRGPSNSGHDGELPRPSRR